MTRHLTDEELSDVLDGGSSPHVEVCAECATRLESWRAAQARLRVPVLVPETARDEAVAAVLGASGHAIGGRRRRPTRRLCSRGRTGPGRTVTGGWAAAAAAAVVLVIAAVVGLGVGLSASHHHGSQVSASAAPATGGPNLGAVDGPGQLAAAVQRAFPAGTSANGSTMGGFASASANASAGAIGGASGSGSGATSGTGGTTSTGATPGSGLGPPGHPPAAAQRSASTTVAPQMGPRAVASPPITLAGGTCGLPKGTVGSILFVGTVEYRSVPARVVVVRSGANEQAIVQSEAGCRLLVVVAILN